MTSSREYLCPGCYLQHYSSERFKVPDAEYGMGIEFYEDNQAIPAKNEYGETVYIIGRSTEGVPWVWTVDGKGQVQGNHPSTINAGRR